MHVEGSIFGPRTAPRQAAHGHVASTVSSYETPTPAVSSIRQSPQSCPAPTDGWTSAWRSSFCLTSNPHGSSDKPSAQPNTSEPSSRRPRPYKGKPRACTYVEGLTHHSSSLLLSIFLNRTR